MEKPNRAAALRNTLATVTPLVVKRAVSRSDRRLEQMVPPVMIMETMPAAERGWSKTRRMVGQPEPSRESGRPRLMNTR